MLKQKRKANIFYQIKLSFKVLSSSLSIKNKDVKKITLNSLKIFSNNYKILKDYGCSSSTSLNSLINSFKTYSRELIELKENNIDLCFPFFLLFIINQTF